MQIDGFTILHPISEGAYGQVYKAWDHEYDEHVAIKVLKEPEAIDRFEREAIILMERVSHPNLIDVHGFDMQHDPPYIVFEYCDAGSLDAWADQPQPWRDVAAVLFFALSGLSEVHRSGGFHRDIKPHNILLVTEESGQLGVKLADFGLARVPAPGSHMTDTPGGTPAYMAPEAMNRVRADERSDIYSMGMTGIELLTGSLSIDELATIPVPEPLRQLLRDMVRSAASERPNCSECLAVLYELLTEQTPAPAPRRRRKAKSPDLAAVLLAGGVAVGVVGLIAAVLAAGGDDG